VTLFIWPFLVSIGKLLIPNLIRTAVPVLASSLIQKVTGGPPQGPQSAAYYDDEGYEEDYEEYDEYDEYEDSEGEGE